MQITFSQTCNRHILRYFRFDTQNNTRYLAADDKTITDGRSRRWHEVFQTPIKRGLIAEWN